MKTNCTVNGRHIIIGTPELFLSLGALSLAQADQLGFTKLEGTDELAIELETEMKKKMRACRGVKSTVKTSNRKFDLTYKTTLGNLGVTELGLLYHSEGRTLSTAQPALANVAGNPFNFDTGADGVAYVPGRWMQLQDATGKAVHDLSAITVVGGNASYGPGQDSQNLTEGVDYEVDLKTGQIAFAPAIDDDVITVNLTAPEITAASTVGFLQGFKPGTKFTHRGFGKLYVWDDDEQDNLAMKHEGFQFEMVATSGPTMGDEEFASVEVEITILNPSESELYARPDVDVWGAVLV